jgi:4'-phosphopantetheinyl transferase EntD
MDRISRPIFCPTFRLALRHGRCVGVALPSRANDDGAIPASVLAGLPGEEQRHVQALPVARRASWVGGRIALRAALADLALDPGAILSTPRGAPQLPAGMRGSISHKDGVAVALASAGVDDDAADDASAPMWHLGVDVERVLAGRPDISGHVLRPEEAARLPPLDDPRRAEEILFAFSAKEAIYKALDPFVARHVSFAEVAIERRDDGTAGVTFFLAPRDDSAALDGPVAESFVAQVAWLRRDDLILTTARVARAP